MYQHDIEKYLNFRELHEEDLKDVLAIEWSSYQFPWTEAIFKDCFKSQYECLAIELHDELIGYVVMSLVLDEAHLLNICIGDKWRKQGIGRASLNYIFDSLLKQKARSLFLEVRPSNESAISLYRSLGFDHIGVRKSYYPGRDGREDALVMLKSLSH